MLRRSIARAQLSKLQAWINRQCVIASLGCAVRVWDWSENLEASSTNLMPVARRPTKLDMANGPDMRNWWDRGVEAPATASFLITVLNSVGVKCGRAKRIRSVWRQSGVRTPGAWLQLRERSGGRGGPSELVGSPFSVTSVGMVFCVPAFLSYIFILFSFLFLFLSLFSFLGMVLVKGVRISYFDMIMIWSTNP